MLLRSPASRHHTQPPAHPLSSRRRPASAPTPSPPLERRAAAAVVRAIRSELLAPAPSAAAAPLPAPVREPGEPALSRTEAAAYEAFRKVWGGGRGAGPRRCFSRTPARARAGSRGRAGGSLRNDGEAALRAAGHVLMHVPSAGQWRGPVLARGHPPHSPLHPLNEALFLAVATTRGTAADLIPPVSLSLHRPLSSRYPPTPARADRPADLLASQGSVSQWHSRRRGEPASALCVCQHHHVKTLWGRLPLTPSP